MCVNSISWINHFFSWFLFLPRCYTHTRTHSQVPQSFQPHRANRKEGRLKIIRFSSYKELPFWFIQFLRSKIHLMANYTRKIKVSKLLLVREFIAVHVFVAHESEGRENNLDSGARTNAVNCAFIASRFCGVYYLLKLPGILFRSLRAANVAFVCCCDILLLYRATIEINQTIKTRLKSEICLWGSLNVF